jgi:hypothetical protein
MSRQHEPDLESHPHISETPLHTGNPPETQADREDAAFSPPTWVVDRMSAGILMLIIVAIILGVGIFLVSFLYDFRFW